MHAAEGVLPVGVGELAGEGLDDHPAGVFAGLVVEIGGVDQAGGVDPAHARCTKSWVCTLPFYQSQRLGVPYSWNGLPRTRPVQPHGLPGPDLRDLVDVLVGHHADHRIAAGDRMVGPQDHGKTVRRHLNCTTGGTLARQLTVRPAVLQRHADQPHADPVAAVGDLPVGTDQHIGVDEPVVARTGHHHQLEHVVLDGGHRRLVQFREFVGVLADRQHIARLQGQRPDRRHHVVGARAEHRRHVDAAAHRQIGAQPGVRRPQRDHLRRRGRSECCWCRTAFR